MDGNKKIRGIFLAGIAAFALNACKVQEPGYVSLYVDNFISVNDTAANLGETSLNMLDTMTVTKAELPDDLHPDKKIVKVSSESVYQHEVKNLLKAITDSIRMLRHQVIELHKQLIEIPDTSSMREKPQEFWQADSLPAEADIKQVMQFKNDTIQILRKQVAELTKYTELKPDTVYITKDIATQFKGEGILTDFESTYILKSKNDTIASLRKQVEALKRSTGVKADTIYVKSEATATPAAENQQADHLTQQLIKAKDDQIQILQNQLNEMKAASARLSPQTEVARVPVQTHPTAGQQPDQYALQLIQAQNDTIQLLRAQLQNFLLQPQIRDTVDNVKEAKEPKPVNGNGDQRGSGLQSLQDTIRLLKNRVLSLEQKTQPGKDMTDFAVQEEKEEPLNTITDTILLVAYYELGKIEPIGEDGILQQINELYKDVSVTKIILSGYTDSSGNEEINKEITQRRLDYLTEMITPWIKKEKIFFQNFGDTFASDMVKKEERRIEIRMHTK